MPACRRATTRCPRQRRPSAWTESASSSVRRAPRRVLPPEQRAPQQVRTQLEQRAPQHVPTEPEPPRRRRTGERRPPRRLPRLAAVEGSELDATAAPAVPREELSRWPRARRAAEAAAEAGNRPRPWQAVSLQLARAPKRRPTRPGGQRLELRPARRLAAPSEPNPSGAARRSRAGSLRRRSKPTAAPIPRAK